MSRVLITGGAGFVGSHLCRRLLSEGCEIVCLDNFYTGSRENIADMVYNRRFRLIDQDIEKPLNIKVDQIYNLACPASPVHYQKDPVKTLKTSICGIMNVLELTMKAGAKLLHTSTSEVYGDALVHPQPEKYWGNVNPIGLRACYDEGKRCAEAFCFDYCRQYGIDVKVVRIFNTYGPYMDANDGRVVSNFIVQALKNEDITIYGTGGQTRSFCYIDDLVEGLIRMMASEKGFIGPVNLGNPSEFTILELAKTVINLTGSKSQIAFKPLPPDDPRQRRPDISLAKAKLSWQPKIDLVNGLKETISYFKSSNFFYVK